MNTVNLYSFTRTGLALSIATMMALPVMAVTQDDAVNVDSAPINTQSTTQSNQDTALAQHDGEFTPTSEFIAKIDKFLAPNALSIRYYEAPYGQVAIGVVTKELKKMMFYTNATGDYLLSGMMYDTNTMINLNQAYSSRFDIEIPTDMQDDIESLYTLQQGEDDADVEIFAIVDHNCGFCHRLNQTVQNAYANDQWDVKVNWAVVGIMGQDSVKKAHKVLAQTTNEAAMSYHLQGMAKQPVSVTSEEIVAAQDKVKHNESFMRKYGIGGVPAVFVKQDGEWQVFKGLPPQSFFASLPDKSLMPDNAAEAAGQD